MPRILIIDDDPAIRDLARHFLKGAGYDADTAQNGRQGLDLIREGGIDLVVTSVIMPQLDGIELMLALRELNADIPVIALSGAGGGLSTRDNLEIAAAFGSAGALAKPFSRDRLIKAVSRALEPAPAAD